MASDPIEYVVYFDCVDRREHKIHSVLCGHYLNRKPEATTTRWSKCPYPSRRAAAEATGVTRECKRCKEEDADPPAPCRPAVASAWTIGGCVRRCRSAWRRTAAWWGRRRFPPFPGRRP